MIRDATPDDATACADILNDWIDATPWMPRVHSEASVRDHYARTVLPERQVWVTGDPVDGFLVLEHGGCVTALYLAAQARRRGTGRALLDRAKARRPRLDLWTFQANEPAQAFYLANGFTELARTNGDNEESLPDIHYGWSA